MPESHIEVGERHKAELAKLPEAQRDRILHAIPWCVILIVSARKEDATIILRMLTEAVEAVDR